MIVLGQSLYGFEGTMSLFIFGAGALAMAALAMIFVRLPLRVWLWVGMLLASSLAPALSEDGQSYKPGLFVGIQIQRAYIQLFFGIALSVVVLATGRINLRSLSVQGLLMLAIGLYGGLISFIHTTPGKASEAMLFALATIPCVLIGFSDLVRSVEGCRKILRGIMMTGTVWATMAAAQFASNPRMLVNNNGRFNGLMANPQHAAVLSAIIIVVGVYLLLNDPLKHLRLLWALLIAVFLLFVGWTASRTGMLMVILGILPIIYTRLKNLIVLVPIGAVILVVLSYLADALEIGSNLDRLTSLQNTREGAIEILLEGIRTSPLVGVGLDEAGASENSYLFGFASYGVGMFALIIAFLFVSMWVCMRLWIKGQTLSIEGRALAYLVIAINAMYFFGSLFEGYIIGRAFPTQVVMLVFTTIAAGLFQQASEQEFLNADNHDLHANENLEDHLDWEAYR